MKDRIEQHRSRRLRIYRQLSDVETVQCNPNAQNCPCWTPCGSRMCQSFCTRQIPLTKISTPSSLVMDLYNSLCPLCSRKLCGPKLCDGCGSLEGIDATSQGDIFKPPTGRTFGFDWQNGCLSPFECAPKSLISKALEAARIGSGDYVAELGCGDGRVALQAESLGATVLGVELSGDLLLQAIRRRKESRRNGADFLQQDIRQLDFRHFTVLVVFLLPAALDAPWLSDKLLGAVEAGSRVLSFAWPVKALKRFEKAFVEVSRNGVLAEREIPVSQFYVYERVTGGSLK